MATFYEEKLNTLLESGKNLGLFYLYNNTVDRRRSHS